MKILILYATNSGGTREAADIMQRECLHEKNSVGVVSAHDAQPDDVLKYDLVIFGSCTWELITPQKRFEGTLHQHFVEFKGKAAGKEFPGKKIAVYGLGDTSYTNFCIAANHLEALVKQLKAEQIGPTLRINKFFFDYDRNEKEIKIWMRSILHTAAASKKSI